MTARQNVSPASALDHSALSAHIAHAWDGEIIAELIEYVKLPAKSPHFDRDWETNGHIEAAIRQAERFVARQAVPGLQLEIVRIAGRTPVLFFDIPATGGLDDTRTVVLYGRGSADDGYAVFAALAAINALDAQGVARPRCVGLIETCEESGSYDLPAYLDLLQPRLGDVQLIVALDSGAGNYEQLWVTTSLRGLINGTLTVNILTEGVHSGDAGGVVPSSFRIARTLLDRIDDSRTGVVTPAAFNGDIPPERIEQARQAAAILGDTLWQRFPWASCCDDQGTARLFAQPTTKDPVELILNRTWRAALAVTGADGLPPVQSAGNVQRPFTTLKLSLRLPPVVDGQAAARALKETLEHDAPHQADVRFDSDSASTGWNAPATAPWLAAALDAASQSQFGKPAAYMGEGGTIPFMGMLGAKFPESQMLVTGVLGPHSNAHGPNEFLHIDFAKRVTAATALVIAAVR